jgi:hypothetical protein
MLNAVSGANDQFSMKPTDDLMIPHGLSCAGPEQIESIDIDILTELVESAEPEGPVIESKKTNESCNWNPRNRGTCAVVLGVSSRLSILNERAKDLKSREFQEVLS